MVNFFLYVNLIMQLLPQILALISKLEEIFPQAGIGASVKLPIVLGAVKAIVASNPESAEIVKGRDIEGTITTIASGAVTALKAANIFK